MKVKIDVLPPSVNHYLGRRTGGGVYRTKEATNWLTYTSAVIKRRKRTPFKKIVEVYITVNYETTRSDLDNFCKVIMDSLVCSGIIKDDSVKYISAIFVYKGRQCKRGKGSIELEVIEAE